MRKFAAGRASELFGEMSLEGDKYMRIVGVRRQAEQAFQSIEEDTKSMLEAYASGINDFVDGVDFFADESTGRLLPPEFIVFGINK